MVPMVLLVLIFVGIFVVPQLFPPVQEPQADLAVSLADQIKTLPTLNDQSCNGASELVSNTATVLQDMDGTLGTGFGHVVQFDLSNCDIVVQFLPILGSYNSLIRDSRTLDPKNSTSVKTLLCGCLPPFLRPYHYQRSCGLQGCFQVNW